MIFELGRPGKCGVDLPEPELKHDRLGGLRRRGPIGLPGLSEPEVVRHYVRLSRKNYAIDSGFYPLGSCTMKHNPRLNEKMARLPGFADIHPLQPVSTIQGALSLIDHLAHWLKLLTNMPAVAMSPKAGAHGELCGLMAIKAAHEAHGQKRNVVLVPESAHGTNPATAALVGYTVEEVPGERTRPRRSRGTEGEARPPRRRDHADEPEHLRPVRKRHARNRRPRCTRRAPISTATARTSTPSSAACAPAISASTRCTSTCTRRSRRPTAAAAPAPGPVVLSAALAPFAPLPLIVHGERGFELIEDDAAAKAHDANPFGRMCAFHGQMGMFTRAMAYMLSHGADGLAQVAGDAVLNANYILASLKDVISAPFGNGPCMHEALFDDSVPEGHRRHHARHRQGADRRGLSSDDDVLPARRPRRHADRAHGNGIEARARRVHPASCAASTEDAKAGNIARFEGAPHFAPRRRLDETAAARKPVLRWTPPPAKAQAAE